MELKAPNGKEIIGTSELTPGTAMLANLERDEDGQITYDHAGDTKMCWDGQETVTRDGEVVFVDEDYNEWLESELIPVDAPADPNAKPKPSTTVTRELSVADLATILAALRYYQEQGMGEPESRDMWIHEIATNGGEVTSHTADMIDDLCERINSDDGVRDFCDEPTYQHKFERDRKSRDMPAC